MGPAPQSAMTVTGLKRVEELMETFVSIFLLALPDISENGI